MLVNANVESVEIESNRVVGVALKGGVKVPAPLVVSAAGAEATAKFFPLYRPPQTLQGGHSAFFQILPKSPRGISHMYAFIGLKGGKEELKLPSSNLWALPSLHIQKDLDRPERARESDVGERALKRYYEDPWPMVDEGSMLLFIGFPSAKDPESETGKSTCVARLRAGRLDPRQPLEIISTSKPRQD